MIEGYFDPAGRPYVRAYVVVPGLQSGPEATALLLDTGADNTFIQPAGARILGIRTQNLSPTGTSRGIGGTTSYATVPAFIAFQDRPWPWRKTRLVYFQTVLAIAMPDRGNRNLPSLLGRDVIDRCRLLYDKLPAAVRQDERQAPTHPASGGRDNDPLTAPGLTPGTPTDQG